MNVYPSIFEEEVKKFLNKIKGFFRVEIILYMNIPYLDIKIFQGGRQ